MTKICDSKSEKDNIKFFSFFINIIKLCSKLIEIYLTKIKLKMK